MTEGFSINVALDELESATGDDWHRSVGDGEERSWEWKCSMLKEEFRR
jgi:hypothetical protein